MRAFGVHILCLALVAAVAPRAASAQIFQVRGSSQPSLYASATIGYFVPGTVIDGRTDTEWDFGSDLSYRVSLEVPVGRGATVGVLGSFARVPLDYRARDGSGLTTARADVWSAGGTVHIGGGRGFHQVIDISAGALGYANFRDDDTDAELEPERDVDVFVSIGYGFGIQIGRQATLTLVQDLGYSFHQREGLSGSARTATRFLNLRGGVRMGF